MEDLFFCVVLPTYRRRDLLRLVLDGLCNQSYKDFEVLVVAKPSGDGTEDLVRGYHNDLNIKLILQPTGYVTDALNLGLKNAGGDAVAFLDDDAVPAPDWLQKHAETYKQLNVAGVAGDAVTSQVVDGKVECQNEPVKVPYSRFQDRVSFYSWDRPLPGTDRYFVCITRGGAVSLAGNFAYWRSRGRVVNSFLGMGANMTVLIKAVRGFFFENSWILGLRWEQMLAWHIWKKGGIVVFNPNPKVFHVIQGQTLSRNLTDKKATLSQAENELFYYRLHGRERGLSSVCHSLSVFHRTFAMLKNRDLPRVRGIAVGNFIGARRLILEGSNHDSVLKDLEALRNQDGL